MTDRELLELAAKAAGIEWFGYYGDDDVECQYLDIGANDVVPWNPLTDDGDALRLAVTLKMDLLFDDEEIEVAATQRPQDTEEEEITYPWAWEKLGSDPLAATRRAIVRAAAEIGRSME